MTDVVRDAGPPAAAPSAETAPQPPAGELERGWNRLDPRYVTMRRIGGWIRTAVFAVVWAVASLIGVVVDLPRPVWVVLAVFGLVVLTVAILGQVWPRLSWKRASYRVGGDGIEIRRGVWWRSMTTVPRSRVQHTDVTQGPIERSFGLGTLVLYTAGTNHSQVVLPGLAHADASAIRDRLAAVDDDDAL